MIDRRPETSCVEWMAVARGERGAETAVTAVVTVTDDRFDYGEVRNSTAGWLNGRMVTVIWTARGPCMLGAPRHAELAGLIELDPYIWLAVVRRIEIVASKCRT